MMVGHFLGMKTEQNMRKEFFDTIQLKPLRYHDNARTGDLQALATNDLRRTSTYSTIHWTRMSIAFAKCTVNFAPPASVLTAIASFRPLNRSKDFRKFQRFASYMLDMETRKGKLDRTAIVVEVMAIMKNVGTFEEPDLLDSF